MTDLTPVPSFDPVVQLETTTLALGGVSGPMNFQAQSLLNRTQFLYEEQLLLQQYNAALENSLDPLKGAAKLGRSTVSIASIDDLLSAKQDESQAYAVAAFYPGAYASANPSVDSGAGIFKWSPNVPRTLHTGGTVISPTVPWDGTHATLAAFLAGSGETAPGAFGCFVLEFGGSLSAKQFGAKFDGVSSDSAATNKALAVLSPIGGNLILSPGRTLWDATVSIVRFDTSDFVRVGIIGPGSAQCEIMSTLPATNALEVFGSAGTGVHSYITLKGFRMTNQGLGTGTGALIKKASYYAIDDVIFGGYNIGLKAVDNLTASFDRMMLRSNNFGAQFSFESVSRPNALTFKSCVVTGNAQWGMQFFGGTNINFLGGSVEGNGSAVAPGADGGGLAFIDSCVEGGVIVDAFGVYFEGNSGLGDIASVNSSPTLGVGSIVAKGCTFQRLSNVTYVPNNIYVAHTGKVCVDVTGCGFKAGPGYTPNSAHKYIGFSGVDANLVDFIHSNMYESALEVPVFAGREISKETAAAAILVFNGNTAGTGGVLNAKNILSKTKTGTGVYDIVTVTSFANAEPSIQVNPESTTIFGFYRTLVLSSNSFRVSTFNSSSAAADFDRVRITVHGA